MANPEHVKILKQGVEVWNQWRDEHPNTKIDLHEVDLHEVVLNHAGLSGAHLEGANLEETHLFFADLQGTHLEGTHLEGANLTVAHLEGAIFQDAQGIPGWVIQGLDDKGRYLQARLIEAIKNGFKHLSKASLFNADLSGANLHGADLSGANLNYADLTETDLSGANLSGADFNRANLRGANLRGANLRGANLRGINLGRANLSQATITGVCLYNTARDDWIIDGIRCKHVFWDEEGKNRTPKDRDFSPNEFEELYKQLPTFEYAFEHGITLIDIAMINQIVNDIKGLHPEWELKIDSFHSRGQPHVNFTIREKDLIAQAFTQIKTKYEETLNRLKGQYEESNRILAAIVKELTNKPQLMITGDIIMGDKRIGRDNIEISGYAQVNQLSTGNSGTDSSDSTE